MYMNADLSIKIIKLLYTHRTCVFVDLLSSVYFEQWKELLFVFLVWMIDCRRLVSSKSECHDTFFIFPVCDKFLTCDKSNWFTN